MQQISFFQDHNPEAQGSITQRTFRMIASTILFKQYIKEPTQEMTFQLSPEMISFQSPKKARNSNDFMNRQQVHLFQPILKEEGNKITKYATQKIGKQLCQFGGKQQENQKIGKFSNSRFNKDSENNILAFNQMKNYQNSNSNGEAKFQNLIVQRQVAPANLTARMRREPKESVIFQQVKYKQKRTCRQSMRDIKDEYLNSEKAEYPSTPVKVSERLYPASQKKQKLQHSMPLERKKVAPAFISGVRSHTAIRNPFDIVQQKKFKPTIQSFIIMKELGKGVFGKVVLAKQKESGAIIAIKSISKNQIIAASMVQQIIRELKIQMYVDHPNIIKVYGFFDDATHLYIIMEAALGTHLYCHLNRIPQVPEEEAAKMMYQISDAVRTLHSQNIIHRDLKPENILLHQGVLKLCDFGWSVHRPSSLRSTFCGTPLYMCPQLLTGNQYDESIDIWALGVIFYEMLYKTNPFNIQIKQELLKIIHSPIVFPEESSISETSKDLIQKCLKKKSSDRININQMINHEFFKKFYVK